MIEGAAVRGLGLSFATWTWHQAGKCRHVVDTEPCRKGYVMRFSRYMMLAALAAAIAPFVAGCDHDHDDRHHDRERVEARRIEEPAAYRENGHRYDRAQESRHYDPYDADRHDRRD
jgi:hypothetical protein